MSTIKATQLNLSQQVFLLHEDIVDNDERVSHIKWYDVNEYPLGVESLELTEEGKVSARLKGRDSEGNSVDYTEEFNRNDKVHIDKASAIEVAYEYNSKQQEQNSYEMQQSKKELEKIQNRIKILESKIEKGKEVDSFFYKWMDKTSTGEIYPNR